MSLNFQRRIAIIGLGYVGLPAAVAFSRQQSVIAFDKNPMRINALQQGFDKTGEVAPHDLKNSNLQFTYDPDNLKNADFYIIAVPTPINDVKHPDLSMLLQASETVGRYLKTGDIVVFESTVYPGVTEDECVPILTSTSSLTYKKDFNVAYSPERINPGDQQHRFENIVKVVSASTKNTLDIVADVYGSVVTAGVYRAPDIKTAEAAKVIENTQRDINIALMNELAVIFDRMNIDTLEVLKAASTKWNFLPFKPGLVGGHCIGVDPYYLTYQAQRYGYNPEVILAGRRINDTVGKFIASQTVKKMLRAGYPIKNATVGILGFSFKENCTDVRNTKVVDIIHELEDYGIKSLVHDPIADSDSAAELYNIQLQPWETMQNLDTIIIAVAHEQFYSYTIEELHQRLVHNSLIIDVKGILDINECRKANIKVWRL